MMPSGSGCDCDCSRPSDCRRWARWRRDDFYELLPQLLRGEDFEFQTYIQRLAQAERGLLGVTRDHTRERRDRRRTQSERLSALGEMAARIAHEVRNPLVSIGAAAQVIAEELPTDSAVRPEAVAIGNEVQRLDRILQNVLRFARPTRATVQRTDVVAVLREVVDLLRGKAHGLQLRVDVPTPQADGGVTALIDGDQLRQVLWNVLINACEAATPGSDTRSIIECTVRKQRGTSPHDRPVLITIADRGPGISPAVRRRVFDPFFSTKTRGTGLGLAISKQIIEESG